MPRGSSTLEDNLWAWLRDGAPPDAVLERVENAVKAGTPDVFGCWRGGQFACELKVWPRELEAEQASFLRRWHRAGGWAFVLWQFLGTHYLLRAQDCHLLLAPMTAERRDVTLGTSRQMYGPITAIRCMSGKLEEE